MEDKIVIVTGAGSGIGAATAKLFSKNKATVVLADINLDNLNSVADAINVAGGNAVSKKCNVTKISEVERLVNETVATYGKLDVMVNNAGIGPSQMNRTDRHTLEDWDNVIAVNQTGVFYCMKLALTQMAKQGHGNIVNVASLAGLKASGNNLCYAASKFAVVGMTKAAALEFGKKNIRINAVCPGYTETDILNKLLSVRPDMGDILKSHIPMNRFGLPEEIAEAIVWLASDATKFITGQTIVLDGGTSL